MRFNTTELVAQIAARLPDNTIGSITPAVMRSMLTDMVQSLRSTGSYIAGVASVSHGFATNAFQMPPTLFATESSSDVAEITASAANSNMTALFDSNYKIGASFSLAGNANERMVGAIVINGLPQTYFKAEVQMAGAGNPVSLDIDGVVRLVPGDTVSVWLSSVTAPATVVVSNAAITAELVASRT